MLYCESSDNEAHTAQQQRRVDNNDDLLTINMFVTYGLTYSQWQWNSSPIISLRVSIFLLLVYRTKSSISLQVTSSILQLLFKLCGYKIPTGDYIVNSFIIENLPRSLLQLLLTSHLIIMNSPLGGELM